MIEALVAAMVISIGILALLQMQISGLRQVMLADNRQQLLWLAEDLAERGRSEPEAFRKLNITQELQWPQIACMEMNPCSAAEFAIWQFREWEQMLSNAIPDGRYDIARTGDGEASEIWQLTIVWMAEQEDMGFAVMMLEFLL